MGDLNLVDVRRLAEQGHRRAVVFDPILHTLKPMERRFPECTRSCVEAPFLTSKPEGQGQCPEGQGQDPRQIIGLSATCNPNVTGPIRGGSLATLGYSATQRWDWRVRHRRVRQR